MTKTRINKMAILKVRRRNLKCHKSASKGFHDSAVTCVAATAQWNHRRLPSCALPGSNPKPSFSSSSLVYFCHLTWNVNRTKINKKRPGFTTMANKCTFSCYLKIRQS